MDRDDRIHYHINVPGELAERIVRDCGEEGLVAYITILRRTGVDGRCYGDVSNITPSSLDLVNMVHDSLDALSEHSYLQVHRVTTFAGELTDEYIYLPYHDKAAVRRGGRDVS